MMERHFALPVHHLLGGQQHPQPGGGQVLQLLEVQGVKGMILICAGGLLLSVLWPLQRILQGMVALKMQVAPRRISTGGKLLTLLLAVLLAGVSCLAALGATL